MTLSRGPYSELDKMSLFQDLKLKRRKVDSRCSSDGESIADTSTSSPDLLQPLSPKMCDPAQQQHQQQQQQDSLEEHSEQEDGGESSAHHQPHHHGNNVESNNNNNNCLTPSSKLVHDNGTLKDDSPDADDDEDDGVSDRASPDSPGLLIDERPPSRRSPQKSTQDGGPGTSVIRSVADERPRSTSPPSGLALMNSIQLLQQHYNNGNGAPRNGTASDQNGGTPQQHVTVLVTPSRTKLDQPTTLVTLGMRKQAPPSINLNSSSSGTNSSSSSSSNCNGNNNNEEPNRLTSTPQSSTSSSSSSSTSSSSSSSSAVQIQMFQQPPLGGVSKFSSSQIQQHQQQQQHLAQQQMLQAMQQQIRIKKERMPQQYAIVNPSGHMLASRPGQPNQIQMIPNPQQQLYVKRERSMSGTQNHTFVNHHHPRQSPTSPVQQHCNSTSPMQPPMSPSQNNRQQSPVHVGSTNPPHVIIKRERQQPPSQTLVNQAMQQLSPNNQRLPSPSPSTSPLQIRHPMRDAAILFRVKNEAQIPNLMSHQQQQHHPQPHRMVWPGVVNQQQRINGVKPEVIGGPLPPLRNQISPKLQASQQQQQQSPQHHASPGGTPLSSQTPPRNTPTVIMGESCGVRTMVWSYDSPPQVQTPTPPMMPSGREGGPPAGPGGGGGGGGIPPSPGGNHHNHQHHHQNSNSSSSSSSNSTNATTNNNEEAAHLLLSLGQTVRQNEEL